LLSIYILCSPSAAFGQRFAFGLAGGVSLTDDFQRQSYPIENYTVTYYSTAKDYIVGPTLEVGLPFHLSVEVDALYRPLNFAFMGVYPNGSLEELHPSNTVLTWEFPVLAKYRIRTGVLNPFVEAGPSFRASGNLNNTGPSHGGFTAGAGVEAHFYKFRIAPEFRYTRWAADTVSSPPFTNPNQVEFLVGLSFAPR
jgi:hypothetical protein